MIKKLKQFWGKPEGKSDSSDEGTETDAIKTGDQNLMKREKERLRLSNLGAEDPRPQRSMAGIQNPQPKQKENGNVLILTNNYGVVSQGNSTVTVSCGMLPEAPAVMPRQSQKDKVKESIKLCQLHLSVENKYLIAENIGNQWKELARRLPDASFSSGQLFALEKESESQVEVVFDILTKWYEQAPETATVGNLAVTLEIMNLSYLANQLIID